MWFAITTVGTLVAGTVLSVWAAEYVKRPRVRLGGGGMSTTLGEVRIHTTSVESAPSFIGVRLGKTILFGRPIHASHEWGLYLERRPAECTASLVDADGSRFQLYFLSEDLTRATVSTVVTGRQAGAIVILARLEEDYSHYFLYSPLGETDLIPKMITDQAKFDSTKHFTLEVRYTDAKKPATLNLTVRRDLDGRLSYELRGPKVRTGGTL